MLGLIVISVNLCLVQLDIFENVNCLNIIDFLLENLVLV